MHRRSSKVFEQHQTCTGVSPNCLSSVFGLVAMIGNLLSALLSYLESWQAHLRDQILEPCNRSTVSHSGTVQPCLNALSRVPCASKRGLSARGYPMLPQRISGRRRQIEAWLQRLWDLFPFEIVFAFHCWAIDLSNPGRLDVTSSAPAALPTST